LEAKNMEQRTMTEPILFEYLNNLSLLLSDLNRYVAQYAADDFSFVTLYGQNVKIGASFSKLTTASFEIHGSEGLQKRILKELYDGFRKNSTNGIYAGLITPNNIFEWRVLIEGPKDSPYENGIFKLSLTLPEDYPFKRPRIFWVTKIYHANASDRGRICHSGGQWSPGCTIKQVLERIRNSLKTPYIDETYNPGTEMYCMCPLNSNIAILWKSNRVEHDQLAREWTKKYANTKLDIILPI